ncbi:receptor-transporting protein 3-like isoform X1 [Rhincodon typus]|uniref:receptor-transporting protein 3-like isoform X1 n=1 Tax=Rhincodon typus TaxID=259920 RepID=UPI002030B135|nr:receptor-transporting protein 3-like isoform X1 [Rhincodon typus]
MAQRHGTNPWIDSFSRRMDEELGNEDRWTLNFNYKLENDLNESQRKEGWKIYITSSFGRFNCSCSNSWTSAHVVILFHYRLRDRRGLVLLRLFRQQCRDCYNPYQHKPTIRQKEMQKVFDRFILKIRKNCYMETVTLTERKLQYRKTKPHQTSLCEACALGMCCFSD